MGNQISGSSGRARIAALKIAWLLMLLMGLEGCTTYYHGRGILYQIEPQ